MPRNFIGVPLAPAEALTLVHDESLHLKKITSIFIMKIYTFLTVPLKHFRYCFFIHLHMSANSVMPILHYTSQ